MNIVSGLLYINSVDVFLEYGAFLNEDKPKDNTNYSALLKPPAMKPYTAVSFREQHGENLPDVLMGRFEPREVTLQFAISGENKDDFVTKYNKFVSMLGSGWLEIYLPEIKKTYRMHYLSCTEYQQISPIDSSPVVGKFKVKLREPKPTI